MTCLQQEPRQFIKDKEEELKCSLPLMAQFSPHLQLSPDLGSRDLHVLYVAVSCHSDTIQIVQKGAKNSQNFIFWLNQKKLVI